MSERCRCPGCTAEAAALLLETGRPGMALRLLKGQPVAIAEAVGAAYAKGVNEGRRQRPAPKRPTPATPAGKARPGFPRDAAELREHVERLGAERVAEVLAVRPSDLPPLLEGRVGVARAALERLRKAG